MQNGRLEADAMEIQRLRDQVNRLSIALSEQEEVRRRAVTDAVTASVAEARAEMEKALSDTIARMLEEAEKEKEHAIAEREMSFAAALADAEEEKRRAIAEREAAFADALTRAEEEKLRAVSEATMQALSSMAVTPPGSPMPTPTKTGSRNGGGVHTDTELTCRCRIPQFSPPTPSRLFFIGNQRVSDPTPRKVRRCFSIQTGKSKANAVFYLGKVGGGAICIHIIALNFGLPA